MIPDDSDSPRRCPLAETVRGPSLGKGVVALSRFIGVIERCSHGLGEGSLEGAERGVDVGAVPAEKALVPADRGVLIPDGVEAFPARGELPKRADDWQASIGVLSDRMWLKARLTGFLITREADSGMTRGGKA